MEERPDGSGVFVEVMLRPKVVISTESDRERAMALHSEAHRKCFIANSVNFPVRHEPAVS
jgi:organic hydroperoxide reductase OsmC/OhrA